MDLKKVYVSGFDLIFLRKSLSSRNGRGWGFTVDPKGKGFGFELEM